MLDHPISFQDLIQHVQLTATIHHEIFRDDLEPIYNWFLFKDMVVVRDSKANADTIVGIPIETVRGHKDMLLVMLKKYGGPGVLFRRPSYAGKTGVYLCSSIGFPSVRHSPLPLQSFLPLVVPQPPLPLQEFWPLQACLSFLLLEAFLPELAALSPPVFCAIALAVVPATNPDRAAPISSARIDFVMCTAPFLVFFTLYEASLDWSLTAAGHPRLIAGKSRTTN